MKDDVRVPFSFNGHWCKSEQTKNIFNCRIQLNHGVKSTDWRISMHARVILGKRNDYAYNIISRETGHSMIVNHEMPAEFIVWRQKRIKMLVLLL